MKKVLLILFIIIFILVFNFRYHSGPSVIISKLSRQAAIKPGDLTYKVYLFGVFPAGEAVLKASHITQYNAKPVYHLSATASSPKFLRLFFSANAVLDSYVDVRELTPILFKQKISISGKNDIYKEVAYDQSKLVMSISGVSRQILPDTQDPLSLIFNLSHFDFTNIKEFEMNINTNQKNYIFAAKVEPRDLTINKNIYKTFLVKAVIRRRDKNPYHKSNVSIVFLKSQENNIPILINTFASGFFINARLTRIE